MFVKIGSDLYVFLWDPSQIIGFEDEDESRWGEFVVGFASESQSAIAIIHVDIGDVFNLYFLSLLTLNYKFALSFNTISLTAFNLSNVGDWEFRRVSDLDRFGDYLPKLAVEDDGFSFLKIGRKNEV